MTEPASWLATITLFCYGCCLQYFPYARSIVKLHEVCEPTHSMCEHLTCPRCGQPITVAEVEDYNPMISRPVEQEILCPQCDGFIATVVSYRKVFVYKAPVGDFNDDVNAATDEEAVVRRV